MFSPITESRMIPGTKYKIVDDYVRTGIYQKNIFGNCFTNVKDRFGVNDMKIFYTKPTYYEFFPQKSRIQSEMEGRAVNLIIRRLLCDECFEW